MTIFIKKVDSKKETFTIDPSTKVQQIKSMLAEKAALSVDQLRLIYKGTPMKDNESLENHKVEKESVIHMILQMRGG